MRRGCSLSSLCASGCPAARGATTGQTRDFVHNHCPVPPSRWPWRALVKTWSARRTQSGLKAMLFMYGGYGLLSGITARNIPCWARGILFLEPARAFLKRRRSTRSLPDAARRRTGGAPKRSSPRRSARPSASTNGTPSRRRSRRTRCTSRRSPRSVPAHACCEAAGGRDQSCRHSNCSAQRARLTPTVTAFVAILTRDSDCDGAKAETVLMTTAAVMASLASLAPIGQPRAQGIPLVTTRQELNVETDRSWHARDRDKV